MLILNRRLGLCGAVVEEPRFTITVTLKCPACGAEILAATNPFTRVRDALNQLVTDEYFQRCTKCGFSVVASGPFQERFKMYEQELKAQIVERFF